MKSEKWWKLITQTVRYILAQENYSRSSFLTSHLYDEALSILRELQ